MRRPAHSTFVSACIVLAMLLGCGENPADKSQTRIRIAVLPGEADDRLLAKHGPLLDYLRATTGFDIDLTIPRDYADLVDSFDAGRVDLAWFGGLTFTQAVQRSGAVPLAFRDVDLQFTSCYLVDATDARTTVREFQDESFSFGPTLSTSGHLMPRYYMKRDGIDPEEWFSSVQHTTGHDQTALSVLDGAITLGVANCVIVAALYDSGTLDASRVRILETTPPYSDYVWAASPTMDERTRITLLDAFLALDADVPGHREILRLQGANMYMPAGVADFEIVRIAAIEAGVLADQERR